MGFHCVGDYFSCGSYSLIFLMTSTTQADTETTRIKYKASIRLIRCS